MFYQHGWSTDCKSAPERFEFKKEPNRLKGYSSQYWKKHNKKKDEDSDEATA